MRYFTKKFWRNQSHENIDTTEIDGYKKEREKMQVPHWLDETSFHDCIIIGLEQKNNQLTIFLDNGGGFTDIEELYFYDYKILEQERDVLNSYWLTHEIYEKSGKLELNILLSLVNNEDEVLLDIKKDNFEELAYLTISANEIKYKRDLLRWQKDEERAKLYVIELKQQLESEIMQDINKGYERLESNERLLESAKKNGDKEGVAVQERWRQFFLDCIEKSKKHNQ